MRSGAPRERLRFSSDLRMPPERRSRTKPDRRAGAMPGREARPGSGGTPRKAARSSQRTPQAGQRTAPSAVTAAAAAAAAAEEESRLRQRNRLTIEDDKPAAERCLEQLVFGDVEDDEDALLRRLRSSRVREACSRSGHTLPPGLEQLVFGDVEDDEDALLRRLRSSRVREACSRSGHTLPPGARRAARPRGRSLGDLRRRALRWEGPSDRGRRGGTAALSASGAGPRAGEGGDAVFLRPKGAAALGIQQALSCCLDCQKGHLHGSSDDSEVEDEAKDTLPSQKKPVWVDEDDEDEEIVDMMNNRFRKEIMKNASESKLSKDKLQKRLKEEFQHAMGGVPDWAETGRKRRKSSDDESEEDEDDLLQRTGNFISTSASLPRGILKMKNCRPANAERPTTARISSVQFHPGAQVVMVSGIDNAISLFQVDGKTNPKIQSIYLEKFPIFKACFSANGEELLATSIRSKVLYVYDMLAGKLTPVHQVRVLRVEW
ncbi:UTP18 small subunit processome component [Cricetulus griseus]